MKKVFVLMLSVLIIIVLLFLYFVKNRDAGVLHIDSQNKVFTKMFFGGIESISESDLRVSKTVETEDGDFTESHDFIFVRKTEFYIQENKKRDEGEYRLEYEEYKRRAMEARNNNTRIDLMAMPTDSVLSIIGKEDLNKTDTVRVYYTQNESGALMAQRVIVVLPLVENVAPSAATQVLFGGIIARISSKSIDLNININGVTADKDLPNKLIIDENTEFYKTEIKPHELLKLEEEKYLSVLEERKESGQSINNIVAPQPFVKKEIKLQDLRVGQVITGRAKVVPGEIALALIIEISNDGKY